MASSGKEISGDVNVAVAIYVLPFNSALNPFLYTYTLLAEKRRRQLEERLRQRLALEIKQAMGKTVMPRNEGM